MITTNTPLQIDGKPCVLVRDVIGSAPSEKYSRQDQKDMHVWYEESIIREMREAHPQAQVYGLWQVLISSNLLDMDSKLQLLYTNSNKTVGFYLYSNNGLKQSGTIFNGELQKLPGAAIAEKLTAADGKEIDASLSHLVLPDTMLQTHKERAQAAAAKKKASQQQGFLAFSVVVALGLAVDTGLSFHHQSHMESHAKATESLAFAQARFDELALRKATHKPVQTATLTRIYQLGSLLQGASVSGEIDMKPYQEARINVTADPTRTTRIVMAASKNLTVSRTSPDETLITWTNNE